MHMSLPMLFGTAFIVTLSGAMMPGPFLTVTIGEALRRGFWAGPLMVLGHGLLEVSLVAALVAGLGPVLHRPAVAGVIGVAGGVLLGVLGLVTLRDARRGRVQLTLSREAGGRRLHPVPAGAVVSLANPYWTIWWATIGLSYLTIAMERGMTGLVVFYSGHILSDLSWYSLVAAAVAGGRQLVGPRVYRWVLTGCGVVLVMLGVWFVYGALRT